jgi:hypothetical protein
MIRVSRAERFAISRRLKRLNPERAASRVNRGRDVHIQNEYRLHP